MNPAPAVRVAGLTIRFGDFTAVKDISFSVHKGEIFGFLGANGAGKTTTIRVLCGLLTPTAGEVEVAGIPLGDDLDLIKNRVGYMSQKFTLYQDMTVDENLAFTASLRKMEKSRLREREKMLFDFIGFEASGKTLVRDLPGGIKQELSLVASMLHDPEIIFLDEPTAGVSPVSRNRFWALIRQLSQSGKTIFVTTHYMDEAEQCDRIALMRTGELIALDTPPALKKNTFPEPLFEIEPSRDAPPEWKDELKSEEWTTSFQPYGLRYHVSVTNAGELSRFVQGRSSLKMRQIQPSLEDVFIHLVEGTER